MVLGSGVAWSRRRPLTSGRDRGTASPSWCSTARWRSTWPWRSSRSDSDHSASATSARRPSPPTKSSFVAARAPSKEPSGSPCSTSRRSARSCRADTVLVPGLDDPARPRDPDALAAIVDAADRGARIRLVVRRRLRARPRGRAERAPRHDALGARGGLPPSVPERRVARRRALRRRRPGAHVRRDARRGRPLPAHPSTGLRAVLRQRRLAPARLAATSGGRTDAVHEAPASLDERVARAGHGLDPRAPRRGSDASGGRRAGEPQHSHPVSALRGRDGSRCARVDRHPPHRARVGVAGGHRHVGDRHRVRDGLRVPRDVPASVREAQRHDTPRVPSHVPGGPGRRRVAADVCPPSATTRSRRIRTATTGDDASPPRHAPEPIRRRTS